MMKFESLVGQTVEFFGADDDKSFCIRPIPKPAGNARLAFKVKDTCVGTGAGSVTIDKISLKGKSFSRNPIATVIVQEDGPIHGYRLVDVKSGHVWLSFGTDFLLGRETVVFEFEKSKLFTMVMALLNC